MFLTVYRQRQSSSVSVLSIPAKQAQRTKRIVVMPLNWSVSVLNCLENRTNRMYAVLLDDIRTTLARHAFVSAQFLLLKKLTVYNLKIDKIRKTLMHHSDC